ncbi:MAG: N-formylglutamate amidohydrolase, partial [Methanoregula sp.]|nr:N-formylglutamate amidohydrolase [Methanoregula sp.]
MTDPYPFLISIPHGGTEIPEYLRPRLALSDAELLYHCDPRTQEIFGFGDRVASSIDTSLCRMIVDLNRPPIPLPPRDPDGVIKSHTADGKPVYLPNQGPDIRTIHQLMLDHYFPYHQKIDQLTDCTGIRIAFDCHSMLPFGLPGQKDAKKARPLICLGNNGDGSG